MEIIWLGLSCFRLRDRSTIVIADPYQEGMVRAAKPPLVGQAADIVSISAETPERGTWQALKEVRKVLKGPGEYEVAGVTVFGVRFPKGEEQDPSTPRNTAYVFEMDGLRICHLGAPAFVRPLGKGGPSAGPTSPTSSGLSASDSAQSRSSGQALESPSVTELGHLDVLLLPVGGSGTLDGPQAAELARLLEPRIVIPMRYRAPSFSLPLDPLDPFLRAMGLKAESLTPQARLNVTVSNVPESTSGGQVVLLEPPQ
jgi:L-ascorbate metabolism protein UlaG (beta-lactamase superfamily)